eukprot:7314-Heterococcus_DN1.PRE.5
MHVAAAMRLHMQQECVSYSYNALEATCMNTALLLHAAMNCVLLCEVWTTHVRVRTACINMHTTKTGKSFNTLYEPIFCKCKQLRSAVDCAWQLLYTPAAITLTEKYE